ncbi:AraC family transcriptional regulator [Rubrolithibacter danxiaensis]|uniref:AraC family transcriptional regulator n=1 Tax=Rubrolithibacter danxiaensis TaxID=3390805 RepID=UPI003BF8CB65
MKPQLLKVATGITDSFSVRQDNVPYINNKWHYHPEVELIHFEKGNGTQFIGDNIKSFTDGDVLLVGSDLPHYWRFDERYFHKSTTILTETDIRVAHFSENFWGERFLQLPENKAIRDVLEKSKRGLQVTGESRKRVAFILEKMLIKTGTERLILLLEALLEIGSSENYASLSSIGFSYIPNDPESDRMSTIYEYCIANFRKNICTEEIAAIAHLSPNSFCRYFKSRNRKTFSEFMIEIRVGYACKLLIENNSTVKEICFDSGFNNFASFHKYFRMKTGKSPLRYRKEFLREKSL